MLRNLLSTFKSKYLDNFFKKEGSLNDPFMVSLTGSEIRLRGENPLLAQFSHLDFHSWKRVTVFTVNDPGFFFVFIKTNPKNLKTSFLHAKPVLTALSVCVY